MSDDPREHVFLQITLARARVLRELSEGWKEREAAVRLGMTYNGVRSHVRDLKGITGCEDVDELGRWWRANRKGWLRWLATVTLSPSEPLTRS